MDNQRPDNHTDYNSPDNGGNNNNKNGNNGNNGNNGPGKRNNGQTILVFIMFTLIALFVISLFSSHFNEMSSKETSYTEFLAQLEAGNIKSVEFGNYEIDYTLVDDEKRILYRVYQRPCIN